MVANGDIQKGQTYTDRLTNQFRKLASIKLTAVRKFGISADFTLKIVQRLSMLRK